MARLKRVRIIKKIRESSGVWRFISLERIGARYAWDERPGRYFLEWWEGKKRRRQAAGQTPSEVLEAQRRKRNELIGQMVSSGAPSPVGRETTATPVAHASGMFLDHVRVHSPDKPKTHQRYRKVLEHFERVLGRRRFAEAITRKDIDDYKTARSGEHSEQHKHRRIAPRTINYEVSVLRTFFNFLINERGMQLENPCARFKPLRDPKEKSQRKPSVYSQAELDRLFEACIEFERAVFATFLLTGLRDQEISFLQWPDIDLRHGRAALQVAGEGKDGFSPKDYEERILPIPEELAKLLKKLPRDSEWVFPTAKAGRSTHLLRRLKDIADRAGVEHATLHKFRHTYATRLLESGCDIVTVQKLMGHSDIETTRQYLDPDDELKRRAVNRLSIKKK